MAVVDIVSSFVFLRVAAYQLFQSEIKIFGETVNTIWEQRQC